MLNLFDIRSRPAGVTRSRSS